MKKIRHFHLILLLLVMFSTASMAQADDPVLDWHTFMGSGGQDRGQAVAVDDNGNTYVTGYSYASWGSPVNAYTGNCEGFLAKFDSNGNLLWNTFLGCASIDWAVALAVDSAGNIYVGGTSFATWGTPLNAFAGGFADGFLAKFDSSGNRIWNTFLGGTSGDYVYAVALDASGMPFVAGLAGSAWGTPVNAYTAGNDAYVARFDASGNYVWHTFIGGTGNQQAQNLVISSGGDIAVTGKTNSSWGASVRAYTSGDDCFTAALHSTGGLLWHTFLGGTGGDQGYGITVDSSGDYLVVGITTAASWGTPLNAYAGSGDTFVAKLDAGAGNLGWHTFIGGPGNDYGYTIDLDGDDNIYIGGFCSVSWGTPLNAHSGADDLYIAALTPDGQPAWHTYYSGTDYDDARSIVLDPDRNSLLVTGYGNSTWGTPVNGHAGGYDAFLIVIAGVGAAAPTSIPSLTEWGMILLSVGLAGAGLMYMGKRRRTITLKS
ncbi:MAG: SBBP repeat-containing protein [Desulfosalsimonadaceae bacterium]|nr:SBBP repeat-containing protein [Desulfosalsimonadaceae bacterium]